MSAVPLSRAGARGSLGPNVDFDIDGDILTIRIDLKARQGRSSTGKSVIVASTGGNQKVPGTDVSLGLNAYVKG